jgi:RNA polymerase sigma-70 factor (ECF subfamily)
MALEMTPDLAKALPAPNKTSVPAWSEVSKSPMHVTENIAPRPVQLTTRELFETYAGFVMRTVRRLGARPSDTEDVTQEVFMTVHRRIADLHPDVHPRSWLFGIARRVVANYLRKAHRLREQPSNDLSPVARADDDPAKELQLTRERALLERALGRLDTDKREVFVLFELEGLGMQEVADMVGCPLNTAYSRLYAARTLVYRHVLAAAAIKPQVRSVR